MNERFAKGFFALSYLLVLVLVGFFFSFINISFNLYIFFAVGLIPFFAYLISSNKLQSIRPHIIALIMTYFSFFGNYLYMAQFFDYSMTIFNKSAVYIVLCFICLFGGYVLFIPKVKKTKLTFFKYYPSRVLILLSCLFCLFVTLLLNLLGYKTTHSAVLERSNFVLDVLLFLRDSVQAIIYFDCFFNLLKNNKQKYWKEELIVIVVMTGLKMLSGSRGGTILSLFIVPYLYVLIKKRVPVKFCIIAFCFLLFIVPFSIVYRTQALFSTTNSRDIFHKISAFASSLKEVSYDSKTIGFVLAYTIGRFSRLEQSLRMIDWMPKKVPYQNGTTVFPHIFISLIPTALYPNRPLTNIGKWFGVNFKFTDSKNPVFITAGIMNEFYLNFGFWGFLCSFIFGMGMRFAYELWRENREYLFVNLLYYSFFYKLCLFLNESYIVSGILDVFKSSVFTLMILIFFHCLDNHRQKLTW
ncbi:MAG: hypothetical protein IJP62_00740 [Treponema sp.]|nr:hypothetical protein [Treponema sp.]